MILWLYSVLLRAAAPFQHEPERTELRAMARELQELEAMRARPRAARASR
jgi:hypothetical protein